MKAGAELRLTAAHAAGAMPGRSTEGGNAQQATRSSSPFEALFARLRSEPREDGEGGGDESTRLRPGAFADGHKARLGHAPGGEAERGGDEAAAPSLAEPGVAAGLVTLGHLAQGQSLAHAVAQRIASAADGARAEAASAEVATEPRTEAVDSRRGPAVAASLALAIAAARRGEVAGRAGATATPDHAVTRRETHFAPVLTATGAGDAEPTGTSRDGAGTLAQHAGGPFAALRSRAEQLMGARRAAPGDPRTARAEAIDAAPGTAARAASGATKTGGADTAAASTPDSTLPLSAGPGGTAPARAAAPAQAGPSAVVQPAPPPTVMAASGPVKVLHIHLQPAELGTLEVQMRLTDAGLEVHIEATRQETLTMLRNDREALAHVLRGAGHSVETVTVSFADRGAPQGQAVQDGGQSQSFGARADTPSNPQAGTQYGTPREQGGRPDGGFPQGGHDFEKVHDDQDPPAFAARRHGDLYL